MKKIVLLLAASMFVYGCTTLVESQSDESIAFQRAAEPVESESTMSFKGLTRTIAQVDPAAAAGPKDPLLIPKKKGGFYDCRTMVKKSYEFNGQKYMKLILDDDIQLRCPNVNAISTPMPWKVTKESWTAQDENEYGAFIKTIGYSKCKNLDVCLSSATNPLRSEEDLKNMYYADCADLPYFLRAYFAYKKGLPFTFVSGFTQVPLSENQAKNREANRQKVLAEKGEEGLAALDKSYNDLRYSVNGNSPTNYYNTPHSKGLARDFRTIKLLINDGISTGTYRMLNGDFYSPKINLEQIRPGTAIYGTGGHAALIYDVKPSGEILVIDAHPGNSITHNGWIDKEFHLADKMYGGMFKNFRPIKLTGVERNTAGVIAKGLVVRAKDEEIPGYSLEQYDSRNFLHEGSKVTMRDWVSLRLSGGNYKMDPVPEMAERTKQLCDSFTDRIIQVQKAIDSGLPKASLAQYPNNIFGAEGDWETHSSPSSDLRRRSDSLSIVTFAADVIKRVSERDPMISYKGSDLKGELIAAFKSAANACSISYKNSLGAPVKLNLIQLASRSNLMSFDPYMCVELRWGATGSELATCNSSAEKKEIYKLTQFLRNNNVKDEAAVHGYTLQTLRQLDTSGKVSNAPRASEYNILGRLLAL
jgi:hypothetical protein